MIFETDWEKTILSFVNNEQVKAKLKLFGRLNELSFTWYLNSGVVFVILLLSALNYLLNEWAKEGERSIGGKMDIMGLIIF